MLNDIKLNLLMCFGSNLYRVTTQFIALITDPFSLQPFERFFYSSVLKRRRLYCNTTEEAMGIDIFDSPALKLTSQVPKRKV